MYNNDVIGKEIRENYNKIFKIIGDKVGFSKLTYETYMGVSETDTRKNHFKQLLDSAIKKRDNEEINACLDIINNDVKREDKIEDKSEEFFKLGEKIYPKKEEHTNNPEPENNQAKNNSEEIHEDSNSEDEEETEIVKVENDSFLKKAGVALGNTLLKIVRWSSIGIGTLVLVAQILTPGGIGVTIGTIAIPYAIAAATGIPYVVKNWKSIKSKIKGRFFNNRKRKTNSETQDLDFANNLGRHERVSLDPNSKKEKTNTSTENSETQDLDFANDLENHERVSLDPNSKKEKTDTSTENSETQDLDFANDIENHETVSLDPSKKEKTNNLNNRRSALISEIENKILKVNLEIENYEKSIQRANRELESIKKEIEANKYEKDKASYIAQLKKNYERCKNDSIKALEEIKKLQATVHSLKEYLEKLKNNEPIKPSVSGVYEHKAGDKTIYIVNKSDSRVRETIDYTDDFENSRKR